MVLKTELEEIATKNGIRILRLLLRRPYLSFGLTEIASLLKISKSNVLGYLKKIERYNIIKHQKSGRKKVYRINCGLELSKILWVLFIAERKMNLKPASKNAVDFIFNRVKSRSEVFILFGSLVYGLENEKSDIDILVVGEESIKNEKFDFLPQRVEFHIIDKKDLETMKDFLVLEAIMNGIVYKGEVYSLLCNLRSFPKPYALFRLQKAKEFLIKASKLKGASKKYYAELAEVAFGELEALLFKKCILPKKLVQFKTNLARLEEEISKEGEEIWLT